MLALMFATQTFAQSNEITLDPIPVPALIDGRGYYNGVINLTDAITFDETMRGKTVNVPLDVTNVPINLSGQERELIITDFHV